MAEMIICKPGEGPQFSVAGDLYRFLATGDQTGARFALIHALIPPGGGPPPHIHHRETEGFYVLSGELTFYALDVNEVVRAGAGTFVHLPPERPHRFANESEQAAEALILIAPAGLEKMFAQVGIPSEVPVPMQPQDVEALLKAAPDFGVEILH
ncbi:cupin domain-containing protein [bacterium]|nr:cupin domain-containing protein [bacterium]